ncbi:MAG TPA: metal-dependent hydrolase [Pyrinomonadaceae bacterium]
MDNLTHSLVGLAAAKAGLDKLSPASTALCLIAANAPDSDISVLLFGDRWTYLKHHRGITHAIVGAVCLAVVLPLIFHGVDLLVARWKRREPRVKLRGLFIASFIVTATHPFLDWLNNYGVRPLLPWSSQWAYGDLIYIVDPFLWLLFGGTSFLLTSKTKLQKIWWATLGTLLTLLVVFGPVRRQALSNPQLLVAVWMVVLFLFILMFLVKADRRWGHRIAICAFVVAGAYLVGLSFTHRIALSRAQNQAASIANQQGETLAKLAVMPTLANPFQWQCTFKTNGATYRFGLDIFREAQVGLIRYPVPTGELAAAMEQIALERSAKVFLDFARFPVARLKETSCTTQTLLQLADLRYTEPGSGRSTFTLELPVNCKAFGESIDR